MNIRKTYSIRISPESREILDMKKKQKSTTRSIQYDDELRRWSVVSQSSRQTRTSLSKMFHSNYRDKRPEFLRRLNQWSLLDRTCQTKVVLSSKQISEMLKLAVEHEIIPKPSVRRSPSPSASITYLIGTFIDAVIQGYIVADERD